MLLNTHQRFQSITQAGKHLKTTGTSVVLFLVTEDLPAAYKTVGTAAIPGKCLSRLHVLSLITEFPLDSHVRATKFWTTAL